VPFVETTLAENITASTGEGNIGYGAILDSIVIGRKHYNQYSVYR